MSHLTEEMIDSAMVEMANIHPPLRRSDCKRLLSAALHAKAGVSVKGHPDDLAVDRFAAAMKAKLAKKRDEGRGGWDNPDECSIAFLSKLLRDHVAKGDPVDVGNLAMMIQQRGGSIE